MSVADDDSEKNVNIEDDSSFESFSIGSDCGLISIQSVKDSDISETATEEEDTDESDEDDGSHDDSSLDELDKALLAEEVLLQKEEALLRKDNDVSKEEGDDSIPEKAGQTSNNQVDITTKEIKIDVSNGVPNNNRTGSIVDRSPMKSPTGRPLMKRMKSSAEQESETNMKEKNEEHLLSPPRQSSQIKAQDVENEAMNITVEESLRTDAAIVMTHNNINENDQQEINREVSNRQPNKSNTPTNKQYHIPSIINISVSIEEKTGDDRSGLVFIDKGRRTLLSKVLPTSPFINSKLSVNDELLLVNGHRIKNSTKSSEFLKVSAQKGTLTITAFKGKRPRESGLEMLNISDSACLKDIGFENINDLVHINHVDGRFGKSGRIKAGDILMSINGCAIHQSEQARGLLQDSLQSEQSRTIILLVFNLEKLRCRLIRKLELNKKFTWNTSFNECSVEDKVGQQRRILYIQNNGLCEIVMEDDIDKKILNEEVERFAKSFTSQFQNAIGKLRESIQATKYII